MIQCKIFKGTDVGVIERQINVWLNSQESSTERIRIHSTTQSSSLKNDNNFLNVYVHMVITIFYERVKK